MKAFFISLTLILTILILIGANFLYISRLSQDLIEELESAPLPTQDIQAAQKADHFKSKWETHKKFIQITVNHTEIDMICNTVDELCVFAKMKKDAEFERARRILISTLKNLKESEKLSPTNIL